MKILMDIEDMRKLRNVNVAFDIEGNVIIMVCTQRRKDGTHEIFHQDQFSTPE